jgi:uncharacterized surface protein with fasciclin (FAS1) repeats
MRKSKFIAATALASVAGLTASAVAALPAGAATHSSPRSLASVLTSDGNTFDKNGKDFDVVTEAVLAVLAAKPDSAVKVLADPSVKLTAFIPTDKAFLKLASDLTGKKVTSEKKAFATVAGLGIDTVETVLLYHVIAGSKINAKTALKANGATLTTAQGGTFKVKVSKRPSIELRDNDPDSRNPRVVLSLTDINKGKQNKQIAHGIDRVLRPVNL